ncbi:hypothetical protein [Baekduia sp. Peel2402]|uniref:hypothetical protein n=1 Tax=Baekduia sp. Peel2402 TaxID=3458296 RepID=UPI00403E86D8
MSTKRRWAAAVVTAAAAGTISAVAMGQSDDIRITVTAKVTPNKAGTPAHPQGVKVDVKGKIYTPPDQDPPTVEAVDIWFPKGGLYNGGKWPTCSQAKLARGGPDACPKTSIMGRGYALADADGVAAKATVTIVNGGSRAVFAYVTLNRPARVREALRVPITKLGSGPWSYKAHVDIPRTLQIVAGIPLRVQSFRGSGGRGDWIATTSCPSSHRWKYHVETSYATGQVVKTDGSVACRS